MPMRSPCACHEGTPLSSAAHGGGRPSMRSRWSDAEAAALPELDGLLYASRLVGADPSLVLWGGGNTSVKRVERTPLGDECLVLRVKGSTRHSRASSRAT